MLLAAGRSSRMGEGAHKLLLPLDGHPLVARAVEAACASRADAVVVVLGHRAEAVRAALPAGRYEAVVNADHATGMASSLVRGLAALRAAAGDRLAGIVVGLADQPLVPPALFDAVIGEGLAHPGAIVSASYAGQRGTPVWFPAALFAELAAITGDEGGRSVIARHPDQLHLVEWPDARAGLDVDRPEDFALLVQDGTAAD